MKQTLYKEIKFFEKSKTIRLWQVIEALIDCTGIY